MVKHPKKKSSYCQKCKCHKVHVVSQYKKGKDSLHVQGKRRYDRKQKGFGGQTKPILRKKAKTTKKITLRLKCTVCKRTAQKVIGRCKYFDLVDETHKKKKGAVVYWLERISKMHIAVFCYSFFSPRIFLKHIKQLERTNNWEKSKIIQKNSKNIKTSKNS